MKRTIKAIFKKLKWLARLSVAERISFFSMLIAILAFAESRISSMEVERLSKSISFYDRKKALYDHRVEMALYMGKVACLIENSRVMPSEEQAALLKSFGADLERRLENHLAINSTRGDANYDYRVAAYLYGNDRLDRFIHMNQLIHDLRSQVPPENLPHIDNLCSI